MSVSQLNVQQLDKLMANKEQHETAEVERNLFEVKQ